MTENGEECFMRTISRRSKKGRLAEEYLAKDRYNQSSATNKYTPVAELSAETSKPHRRFCRRITDSISKIIRGKPRSKTNRSMDTSNILEGRLELTLNTKRLDQWKSS